MTVQAAVGVHALGNGSLQRKIIFIALRGGYPSQREECWVDVRELMAERLLHTGSTEIVVTEKLMWTPFEPDPAKECEARLFTFSPGFTSANRLGRAIVARLGCELAVMYGDGQLEMP